MLKTKDYKHFTVLCTNGKEISFEGASLAGTALPGDYVSIQEIVKVLKRVDHGPFVGVLELASKVRYGMTARNAPIYRFSPYNEAYPPFFVGCTQKDVSRNVLARIEFSHWDSGTCPRGNLLEIIGPCGDLLAEQKALLLESSPIKWARADTESLVTPHAPRSLPATTFHIDPPGCRDIDDAISLVPKNGGVEIKIHIADVSSWLLANPRLQAKAAAIGQTYYHDGFAVKPMFPKSLSEDAFSLLPGQERPVVTLSMFWNSVTKTLYTDEAYWTLDTIAVKESYTYSSFYESCHAPLIQEICSGLAGRTLTDSHEWVEHLMLEYNTQVARILKRKGLGLLRRHAGKDHERFMALETLGLPAHKLAMRAGEYCLSTEIDTGHWGLNRSAYCHASSPIRRWADCINQLALRSIIDPSSAAESPDPDDVDAVNATSKSAKRFERDIRFVHAILSPPHTLDAVVAEIMDKKIKLWVPAWDRLVTSYKVLDAALGQKVIMSFYADPTQRSWKRRVIIDWKIDAQPGV